MAIKFDKKAIRNADICKQTSPKYKQILIKTSPKQATRKS